MRLVPFVLALVVLGSTAAGAGASPATSSGSSNLCTVSKGVAASIAKSGSPITPTAGTSMAALGKELKASFSKIKAAESVVLANSSGAIKGHFEKVFALDNMIYAELAKANWNILVFAKNAKSLEAGALKIKPDLAAIEAYFAKCKK